jgi:hypothetical protein
MDTSTEICGTNKRWQASTWLDFELAVKVANQRGRSLNMPQEKRLKGLPIQPELKIGIFLFCQSYICIL